MTLALAGAALAFGLPAAAVADDAPMDDDETLSVPFDALGTVFYPPGSLNLNVYPGDATGLRASKFYYEPPATLETPDRQIGLLDADNPGRTNFVIRFKEHTEDADLLEALERESVDLANQMKRKQIELDADPSMIVYDPLRFGGLTMYLKESDGTFTELDMRGVGTNSYRIRVDRDLPGDVAARMKEDPDGFSVVVAPSYSFRKTRSAIVVAERTTALVQDVLEDVLGEAGDVFAVDRNVVSRLSQEATEEIYLRFDKGVSPEVVEKAEEALKELTPISTEELAQQAVDNVVFAAGPLKAEYMPTTFQNMTGPERVEFVKKDLLDKTWDNLKEVVEKETLDESVKEFEKSYGSGGARFTFLSSYFLKGRAGGKGGGESKSERVKNFVKDLRDTVRDRGSFKTYMETNYTKEIDQQLFSEGVTPKDVTLYRVSKSDLSKRLRAVVEEIEALGVVEVRRPMTLHADDATSPTDEMLDRLAEMSQKMTDLAARDEQIARQVAANEVGGLGVYSVSRKISRQQVLDWARGRDLRGNPTQPGNELTLDIPANSPAWSRGRKIVGAVAFGNLLTRSGSFYRKGVAYINAHVPRLGGSGANGAPYIETQLLFSQRPEAYDHFEESDMGGAIFTVIYFVK